MNKTYMNKVERFIVQNREAFDIENAPDSVWNKIQLPDSDKNNKRKAALKPLYKWSIAAAFAGIIFLGSYLIFQKQKPNHINNNNNSTENPVTANIESQKIDSDNNNLPAEDIKSFAPKYTTKIDEIYQSIVLKQNELKNVASANPELYKQFASDLTILDSSYRVLKSQAGSSPNHDVIIKAMIQNLQLQAELLNRQLQIIQQFKNPKKENYETNKHNI